MSNFIKVPYSSVEEWHELRRKGIGGSDAGAIVGLNPYKSPYTVWMEKTGRLEPEPENERMYFGKRFEGIIAGEFVKRTGKRIRRVNALLIHKDYPFIIGNIDRRIVGEPAGLECKNVSEHNIRFWRNIDDPENADIPPYYYLQVQHYMLVTGWGKFYFAVLFGGNHFVHFEVPRDEETIAQLLEAEKEFWQLVEEDTPPAVDWSNSCADALKQLYPQSNGERIELSPEYKKDVLTIVEINKQIKELEKMKKLAQNKLREALGENEEGWVDGYRVVCKSYEKTTYKYKDMVKNHPEIAEQYKKIRIERPLKIITPKFLD